MTENEKATIDAKDEKDAKDKAAADKAKADAKFANKWEKDDLGPVAKPGEKPVSGDSTPEGKVQSFREYERQCMDEKADADLADEKERA